MMMGSWALLLSYIDDEDCSVIVINTAQLISIDYFFLFCMHILAILLN